MAKKTIAVIFASIFFCFAVVSPASAGFGISPPYVKTDRLMPGSRYEQEITLLRSSAESDLVAHITINAPEIEEWITVENGMNFDLPKDKLQVPMKVIVDAPRDAALGNYRGHINVRIASKEGESGGVAVVLGARIEIDLTLTRETFPDFRVRQAKIFDFEELGWPWKWPVFSHFLYRIRAAIRIENTGNVETAPSRIQLEVFDITKRNLLEESAATRFKKVRPYDTADVSASFPTKLGVGEYWGRIKVYKEQEILYTNEIVFKIAPPGGLPGGPPPLGVWPWIMLGGFILIALAIILLLIKIKIWRYLFKLLRIIFWPILFLLQKFIALGRYLKIKFWRWLHRKAEKYKDLPASQESGRNDKAEDSGGQEEENK